MDGDWHPRSVALAERAVHRGSRWWTPIADVPRHVFVPAWWESAGGRWELRRDVDGAYENKSLVTRVGTVHADHAAADERPEGRPTSSSTEPSLLVKMYRYAQLDDHLDLLDVGTGSGYGAAVLCRRFGDEHVTTVDVDP